MSSSPCSCCSWCTAAIDESLHVASTVDALAALGEGGYIGRDDAANLTASYEFLRLLEHRLQLQRLKRTHMLPDEDDDEALRWLARAAHVRPDGKHDALGVLREELKRQSMRCRGCTPSCSTSRCWNRLANRRLVFRRA